MKKILQVSSVLLTLIVLTVGSVQAGEAPTGEAADGVQSVLHKAAEVQATSTEEAPGLSLVFSDHEAGSTPMVQEEAQEVPASLEGALMAPVVHNLVGSLGAFSVCSSRRCPATNACNSICGPLGGAHCPFPDGCVCC